MPQDGFMPNHENNTSFNPPVGMEGIVPTLYAIEAEESVLGQILISPETIEQAIAFIPSPVPFYLEGHQTIYAAMLRLKERGTPPDLMNVAYELLGTRKLDGIGGQSKLSNLIDRTDYHEVRFLPQRLNLILETWRRRTLAEEGQKLANLVADRLASPADINAQLERLAKLKDSLPTTDRDTQLKLDVLAYSNETNPFKQRRLKGEICANYRISAKDLTELVAELNQSTQSPKAKIYTGAEFLKIETQGLQWLLAGVIPARGVTILGGDPGSGKTTLAYDLAASVLYGDEFLGEEPVKQGKVLFVSSDELPCFAQDKLVNRGFKFNGDWQFITDWNVSQKATLEQQVEDFKPALLVVDSFSAIHNDALFDENSSQAKATVYWLEQLANQYGCAVLLIHHTNKNKDQKGVGKLRGSSAIAGACSAVLLLSHGRDDSIKTISSPKIRGSEPFCWDIKLDPENGHYFVVNGKAEEAESKSLGKRILELFKAKFPTKRLEVALIHNFLGGAKEAIWKALDRLVKRGLLIKRPSLRDHRFKVYGLPKQHQTDDGHLDDDYGVHSPPPVRSKVSSNFDESYTEQEIQVLDTILDNYSTFPEEVIENSNCLVTSNEDIAGIPEIILDTFLEEGGECVSSDSGEVPHGDIQDTADTEPQSNIKVGDRVASSDPAKESYHWHGTVKKVVSSSVVEVRWAERRDCKGGDVLTHRVSDLRKL